MGRGSNISTLTKPVPSRWGYGFWRVFSTGFQTSYFYILYIYHTISEAESFQTSHCRAVLSLSLPRFQNISLVLDIWAFILVWDINWSMYFSQQLLLRITTGNPGVCRANPYPYPWKPLPPTTGRGRGFSRVLQVIFQSIYPFWV